MPARRRADLGFLEAPAQAALRGEQPDGFEPAILAVIEKARDRIRAQRERDDATRIRTEKEHRAAEQKRKAGVAKWSRARVELFAAVAAIDRAIGAEGMAISVSDEPGQPAYLAVVQVRVSLVGRVAPSFLEIAVTDDLKLLAKVEYATTRVPAIRLPSVTKVTMRAFADVIVGYLETALPQVEKEALRICAKCGCLLPA